jgi:hypothetical protein
MNGTAFNGTLDVQPIERGIGAVWNTLKTRFFLLHRPVILNIDGQETRPLIFGCLPSHDRLFLQRIHRP